LKTRNQCTLYSVCNTELSGTDNHKTDSVTAYHAASMSSAL